MLDGKIVARTYLHSSYIPDIGNGEDAVVVSEIIENDKGETEPNLKVFKSPQVPFWITQPSFRDHTDKKELEHIERLDEYRVPYKHKDREIFKVLNGFYPDYLRPNQRRGLYQSPFLYGGNITPEALVAMKYKKELQKIEKTPHTPTTGFYDSEVSLLPSSRGRVPLMQFCSENKVFIAMKKSFMFEPHGDRMIEVTLEDIMRAVDEHITPLVASIFEEKETDLADYRSRLPFTYEYFVGETEIEMARWIFGKMHETKTSFIGVWNINFDIPKIISICEEAGVPLTDIFADPALRKTGFAYTNYREDKRDVAHFTQKWHWLTTSAHFQFVDSQCLYSYIRTVEGKESSYKLDYILKKFGLGGKLKIDKTAHLGKLQEADWHREMLSKHFIAYTAYAIWDVISLQLLEWLNNDLTAMMFQVDTTPAKFFPNQTIKVTNTMFQEWLPRGYILGTGVDIEGIADDDLLTEGGAVLEPQNLVAEGMRLFEEWPSHTTRVYAWQNDLDFSAQYPTNIFVANISKQTKLSTMVSITGSWVNQRYDPKEAIEMFCSYLITPNPNGVEMGVEFFDLPGYAEMDRLFQEHKVKAQ